MHIKTKSGKFTALILCFCIMIGVLAPCADINAAAAGEPITDFWVSFQEPQKNKQIDSINWFYQNGEYYLFMPTYADLSNLYLNYSASEDVYLTCSSAGISNKKIVNGEKTDVIKKVLAYRSDITCAGKTYRLRVMKSAYIPAMYLTTESGNLDYIHADKENKEKGNIKVVKSDGSVDCDCALKSIKGRGNATWFNFDKKPYNIKFDEKTDLLGMGKAKGWCLIANAGDGSFVRNKIAYETATRGGIDFTSDSRYVDLYINFNYMGNYLVTEKIEIGKTSVDIENLEKATEDVNDKALDKYARMGETGGSRPGTQKWYSIPNDPEDITGGFLLEFELNDRYPAEASGFVTSRGQSVVLKSPEFASQKQVEYISKLFQKAEDAVYSSTGYNGEGKHYSDYIDVESFAKMYILQEYSANLDNAITSFFVYKDSDLHGDGKFHAAPAWDFDNAYGASTGRYGYDLRDPHVNWTENGIIYNSDNVPHMFNMLYNQKDGKLIDEICYEWFNNYKEVMSGIMADRSCEYSISSIASKIDISLMMNSKRWNTNVSRDMLEYFIPERHTYFNDKFAKMNNINGCIVEGLGDQAYFGGEIRPQLKVINSYGRVLKENTDYKLEYKDNAKVGTASVKITGMGSLKSSRTYSFNIVNGDISDAKAMLTESHVYTGKEIKPAVTLEAPFDKLVQDADYTVSYKNNINAGKATVIIEGMGNFTGTLSRTFDIAPVNISSFAFSTVKPAVYKGKAIVPNITVKAGDSVLVQNKDYTLSFKYNKNIGTASVTVTGINNYTGYKTINFKINPDKVKGLKARAKAGKTIAVSFKKVKKAKKYVIVYSKSKSFKNAKKITAGKTSVKLRGLKSKKTYYIKVYALANGIKGSYSAVKRAKVK